MNLQDKPNQQFLLDFRATIHMANNLGILNSGMPRDDQWVGWQVTLHLSVLHGTTRACFGSAHCTAWHDTHVGWGMLRVLGTLALKIQHN